jgi:anthranilate phosphoribosyltransferase
VWLCTNSLGADELVSFTDNVIHTNGDEGAIGLRRGELVPGAGSIVDIRPVGQGLVVDHFLDVVGGRAGPVATDTVCLNAAALVVAGGRREWAGAVAAARDAMRSGAVVDLVERMRSPHRLASSATASSVTVASATAASTSAGNGA